MRPRLSVAQYLDGILAKDRYVLSRAITLIESNRADDLADAQRLLELLLPHASDSIRIGITGSPGVGKSTFIESFGLHLIEQGAKVAVLAVDPTSPVTGGSIMGDKTRMETLTRHPAAYIRPSASGASLGGVARKTRETILLCEAAGFEVILVETVGVGQSEVAVREMTDFFLLLMLAGAGDELQGIKKGIMEMADAVVITKADGPNIARARQAAAEYRNALHLFPPAPSGWTPVVLTCSALQAAEQLAAGHPAPEMAAIWDMICRYRLHADTNGWLRQNRANQQADWLHEAIRQALEEQFYRHPAIARQIEAVRQDVRLGRVPPYRAALELLAAARDNAAQG